MNNYIVRIFLDDFSILEYELEANTASKASEKALKKYYCGVGVGLTIKK